MRSEHLAAAGTQRDPLPIPRSATLLGAVLRTNRRSARLIVEG
jgi:hypothetical protein